MDPRTAAKLGKGLGAQAVVVGDVFARDDQMRLDARLIHVETGKVILSEEITGRPESFLDLEKQLARKIIDAFGIKISRFEAIDLDTVHSRNLPAAASYGRALSLDERGQLEDARKAVDAAVSSDPEFEQAKALQRQLDAVINKAKDAALRRTVDSLATYEWYLLDWPFENALLSDLGEFSSREYEKRWHAKEFNRALLYWTTHLATATSPFGVVGDFHDITFGDERSESKGVCDLYSELGGAESVLFWCELYGADPDLAPAKPFPSAILDPNLLGKKGDLYRAMSFRRYQHILATRAAAEAWGRWDLAGATATLERTRQIYAGQPIDTHIVNELKKIRDVTASSKKWHERRAEFEHRRRLWLVAEPLVIDAIAERQEQVFRNWRPATEALTVHESVFKEEREKLVAPFAQELRATDGLRRESDARPQARSMMDRMLEDAGGSPFVGRRIPVLRSAQATSAKERSKSRRRKSADYDVIVELHIAGCPWSRQSKASLLVFGSPTATTPTDPNPLIKVTDPLKAIQDGMSPCSHCRPARWIGDQRAIEAVLASRFVEESRVEAARTGDPVEMGEAGTMELFIQLPSSKFRAKVHKRVDVLCNRAQPNRDVARKALVALARVGDTDDIPLLAKILSDSPYWDLRMYAAGVLGSIPSKASLIVLGKAAEQEPFYFVRHFIQAARRRSSGEWQIAACTEDLRENPKDTVAYVGRAAAYLRMGEVQKAIDDCNKAIELDPREQEALFLRGAAYLHQHEWAKAIADHTEVIRLDPRNAGSHTILANAYAETGEWNKAIAEAKARVQLQPDDPEGHNQLAWWFATCPSDTVRDGAEALRYATRACELTGWKHPFYMDTLAAAYAENGQFGEAAKWQQRALADVTAFSREEFEHCKRRLDLYKAGKPYREKPGASGTP